VITRYVQASPILSRRSCEGVLLLAVDTDEPVFLGGSSELVWRVLADPTTFEDLCEVLSYATDTPASTVEADVDPLLRALVELRVVQEIT